MPEASRMFEHGQWATPVLVRPGRPDGDDAMVINKQAAVADLAPRRVHGHQDIGILDQHRLGHLCSLFRALHTAAFSCKTGSS